MFSGDINRLINAGIMIVLMGVQIFMNFHHVRHNDIYEPDEAFLTSIMFSMISLFFVAGYLFDCKFDVLYGVKEWVGYFFASCGFARVLSFIMEYGYIKAKKFFTGKS